MQFPFRFKRNLNHRKQFSISCFRRNKKDTGFALHQSISSDPELIRYRYGSKIQRIGEKRNYLGKKEQCNRTNAADIYEKKKKKIGTAIQFRFLPVAPNLRNSAVRFLFSTARSLIKKYQSL